MQRKPFTASGLGSLPARNFFRVHMHNGLLCEELLGPESRARIIAAYVCPSAATSFRPRKKAAPLVVPTGLRDPQLLGPGLPAIGYEPLGSLLATLLKVALALVPMA